MKKKIMPIILVSLSIVLFCVAIVLLLKPNYFSFKNNTQNQDNGNNQIKQEQEQTPVVEESNKETTTKEETKQEESKEPITKEESKQEENNKVTNTDNKKQEETNTNDKKEEVKDETTNNIPIETVKNENDLISYFTSRNNNITESTNQDDRTLREKAKDTFVTIVDFIFYDKEIKGYKFKELTTNAKLKIIEIALKVDNKIDEYFPDYKEVIKDKYDNITGKLAVKYLEFTSTLCEKVGEQTCNETKENFNNMKEKFSITWELIKELATNGSSKIKKFYETWRDS